MTRLAPGSQPLLHHAAGEHEFFTLANGRFCVVWHDAHSHFPSQTVFPSEQAYRDYVLAQPRQDVEGRVGEFFPSDRDRLHILTGLHPPTKLGKMERRRWYYYVKCERCGREHHWAWEGEDKTRDFVILASGPKYHETFHVFCSKASHGPTCATLAQSESESDIHSLLAKSIQT